MTYHVPRPRRVGLLPQPAPYPVYPLSSAQPPSGVPLVPLPGPTEHRPATPPVGKRLLVGALIVVALLALLAWLNRQEDSEDDDDDGVRPVDHIRKQSTAQMAKNLYERLDERGGVSESTMRSLRQLAKNA